MLQQHCLKMTLLLFLCFALSYAKIHSISTIEEFNKINEDPEWSLQDTFNIMNDIDASITHTWNDGKGFLPKMGVFSGILNGNGHKISNLKLGSYSSTSATGLFDQNAGTIKNLTIEKATVASSKHFQNDEFGVICSYNSRTNNLHTALIESVYVVNSVITGEGPGASLCGRNNGTIKQCSTSNKVVITSADSSVYSGGISGINFSRIERCVSNDTIISKGNVGGITGKNYGVILESRTFGSIESDSGVIGGIAGLQLEQGKIWDSWSGATLTQKHAKGCAGGILGRSQCVNKSSAYGGISETIAYGPIHSAGTSGGICADTLEDMSQIGTSYWDIEATGCATSIGGTGLTADQVSLNESYSGFDFKEKWAIVHKYPEFQWMHFPLAITTYEMLMKIGSPLPRSQSYYLAANIDATGKPFAPLCQDSAFNGHFDGKSHTITGLTLTTDTTIFDPDFSGDFGDAQDTIGLFAKLSGTVEHLILENPTFIGKSSAGALAGYCTGNVSHVHVINPAIRTRSKAGGMIGEINKHATVQFSTVTGGSVQANREVGGFIGILKDYGGTSTTINRCSTATTVIGKGPIGGFIGENEGRIYKSNANCTIQTYTNETSSNLIGGFAGGAAGTISECFSTGTIQNMEKNHYGSAGGFAGGLDNLGHVYETTISNCYSHTSIDSGYSRAAGFIAEATKNQASSYVRNCYATGEVKGHSSSRRGFMSYIWFVLKEHLTMENNYWDTLTTGQSSTTINQSQEEIWGASGESTENLRKQSTFENWDFDSVWTMNGGYPYLQWQDTIVESIIEITDSVENQSINRYGVYTEENPLYRDARECRIFVSTPKESELTVFILDQTGNLIDKMESAAFHASGNRTFVWDLKNRVGQAVASGSYLVVAQAKAPNGKSAVYKTVIGIKE